MPKVESSMVGNAAIFDSFAGKIGERTNGRKNESFPGWSSTQPASVRRWVPATNAPASTQP